MLFATGPPPPPHVRVFAVFVHGEKRVYMCNFVPSVFEREIATWGRWVGGALHNTELFATPVIQDDITSKSEGKPT